MKATFDDYDHLTVMKMHGDLTADQTDQFRKAAEERMAQQVRDFVLDLGETEFVDSQGLEAMLWLQERCAEQLGQVRIAAPTENVSRILDVTRLRGRFDCHDDVDVAMKSLR